MVDDREIAPGRAFLHRGNPGGLAAEYPDDQLRLVIGADNLAGFAALADRRTGSWSWPTSWSSPATAVAGSRPAAAVWPADRVHPRVAISTSPCHPPRIRAMLAAGGCRRTGCRRRWPRYIAAHRLYRR